MLGSSISLPGDDHRCFEQFRVDEAAIYTVGVEARALLRWYSVIEVPRIWASDVAKHFKNRTFRLMAKYLGADHCFSVSNTVWVNGIVESVMLEIVKTFRAVVRAARIPLKGWVRIVPVVQAALNADYRERLKAFPFNLMFGGNPFFRYFRLWWRLGTINGKCTALTRIAFK